MAQHILTLQGLGEEASWLLVQQALGMPDPKMLTDFMVQRVALLVFFQHSLSERLCVSAAIRQMGGSIVEEENSAMWKTEVSAYQKHLLPIFSYYIDCLYLYGMPIARIVKSVAEANFPIINAGSPDAHPAHALADIACMLRNSRYLKGVTCAWLGCESGTLYSLMAATAWFPFRLQIALPSHTDRAPLEEFAAQFSSPIRFVESPAEAVRGANYVLAGCRSDLADDEIAAWEINAQLMSVAEPGARVMLSASPATAIPVNKEILSSGSSLLSLQAEYRLRVHKRMLHWAFLDA